MLGFQSLSLSYRLFYQSPWFPWSSVQGPFLESPGNFTGPKSNIQIEI